MVRQQRVDATVLFTDIVDSTVQQAALGDAGWKRTITRHHRIVRGSLERWGGVENDTAGDGFFVTFLNGADNAVHCALEVRDRLRAVGVTIRAGVHHGSCAVVDGKCCGLTVSIGARVAALAAPLQVVVTKPVADLVVAPDVAFEAMGEHVLKGVPGRWTLLLAERAPVRLALPRSAPCALPIGCSPARRQV